MLDIILIILGVLCLITGLMGCILPFLPGPPVAYLGLVLLHFTDKVQYTTTQLIVWTSSPLCLAARIAVVADGAIGDVSSGPLSAFFSCLGE